MTEFLPHLLAAKGAVVCAWLVLLFAAERWRPAAPVPCGHGRWGWRRLVRNLGLWLVNTGLSPLVVLPITAAAASVTLWTRPDWWSGWSGSVLDVVLLDLFLYVWHRANHELPVLWRFHEVHHLDQFLDTSTALRFHFGEVLLSAAVRAAFIVALAMPLVPVLVFEILVLMATLFHHSNLRLPVRLERGLARLVITPSLHWVHHHARRRDTDSNYGTLFSFWDVWFGTRSPTIRTPGMRIGVENRADMPFFELLLRPFRPRA